MTIHLCGDKLNTNAKNQRQHGKSNMKWNTICLGSVVTSSGKISLVGELCLPSTRSLEGWANATNEMNLSFFRDVDKINLSLASRLMRSNCVDVWIFMQLEQTRPDGQIQNLLGYELMAFMRFPEHTCTGRPQIYTVCRSGENPVGLRPSSPPR